MYQEDYILRLIRQIGQLTARVLGLRRPDEVTEEQRVGDGDPPHPLPPGPEALELVEEAYGSLFGLPRGLVDALDATAVIGLLQRPEAAIALADLLDTDAAVCTQLGLVDRARRRRALATGVRQASPVERPSRR